MSFLDSKYQATSHIQMSSWIPISFQIWRGPVNLSFNPFRKVLLILAFLLLFVLFYSSYRCSLFNEYYYHEMIMEPAVLCDHHNVSTLSPTTFYSVNRTIDLSSGVSKYTTIVFTINEKSNFLKLFLGRLFIPFLTIYLDHPGLSILLKLLTKPHEDPFNMHIVLFIFEDMSLYVNLPLKHKVALDRFCKTSQVGLIAFMNDGTAFSTYPGSVSQIGDLPIYLHRLHNLPWGLYLPKESPVFRITRGGCFQSGHLDMSRATLVPDPKYTKHYSPLLFTRTAKATQSTADGIQDETCEVNPFSGSDNESFIYQSLVILDSGSFDGIQRIIFAASPNSLWANAMLLMDSIAYLTKGLLHSSAPASIRLDEDDIKVMQEASMPKLASPLDTARWIAVDVDDVFIDQKILKQDAEEMVKVQRRWQTFLPGFTFNLGFCGENLQEVLDSGQHNGYDVLLRHKNEFSWFGHTWNHVHPHSLDEETLVQLMQRNRDFAEKHGIPIKDPYSVSPYHDGIFPVYPPLYSAWRRVWNISVSSTYEYTPVVNSVRQPVGFTTHGIQVLPRQTCGIYSRTVKITDFSGGMPGILNFVRTNMLSTVLLNPVSIFMTHMPNYFGDRLGITLFNVTFELLVSWTNLQLRSASPSAMARIYSQRFKSFGANSLPLHSDPCSHVNKANLWPSQWPCGPKVLPQLIILGPQKTGSTALVEFLRLNPLMTANRFNGTGHYEEVQFFSDDRLYSRGPQYYIEQFSSLSPREKNGILFEKSATYFAQSTKTAPRIHALVPDVKLIVILSNPVERAYSWYQHERKHSGSPTQVLSFADLLNFTSSSPLSGQDSLLRHADGLATVASRAGLADRLGLAEQIQRLISKCIDPGRYAVHLRTWLTQFSSSQILLVDGDQLRAQPSLVLGAVQEFLRLAVKIDFSSLLEFNAKKSFHCLKPGTQFPAWPMRNHTLTGCLGASKGRRYPALAPKLASALMSMHFEAANRDLRQMLDNEVRWRRWLLQMGSEYPSWLSSR